MIVLIKKTTNWLRIGGLDMPKNQSIISSFSNKSILYENDLSKLNLFILYYIRK